MPAEVEIMIKVYEDGSIFVASQVQDTDVVGAIFSAALQALKNKENGSNQTTLH